MPCQNDTRPLTLENVEDAPVGARVYYLSSARLRNSTLWTATKVRPNEWHFDCDSWSFTRSDSRFASFCSDARDENFPRGYVIWNWGGR